MASTSNIEIRMTVVDPDDVMEEIRGAAADLVEITQAHARRRHQDLALQIAIAILSIAAIGLISSTGPLHRWGFVIGLVSQPLWILATWRAKQWGMLVLSVFYLFVWVHGILNRFTF